MEQTSSPQVEIEHAVSLLRSLNLTPPPPSAVLEGDPFSAKGSTSIRQPPRLALDTCLTSFGHQTDSSCARNSLFDPFGAYPVGTPSSFSPTTPDQDNIFNPSVSDESALEQSHDRVPFVSPSFVDHPKNLSLESTPPSATPVRGSNKGIEAPDNKVDNLAHLNHRASDLRQAIPSVVGDNQASMPCPNSNSGSHTTGTISDLGHIPTISSPLVRVGSFPFQAPVPYLRSPSPYWRYLPDMESQQATLAPRHSVSNAFLPSNCTQPCSGSGVGFSVTGLANNANIGATTTADGWVPSMSMDSINSLRSTDISAPPRINDRSATPPPLANSAASLRSLAPPAFEGHLQVPQAHPPTSEPSLRFPDPKSAAPWSGGGPGITNPQGFLPTSLSRAAAFSSSMLPTDGTLFPRKASVTSIFQPASTGFMPRNPIKADSTIALPATSSINATPVAKDTMGRSNGRLGTGLGGAGSQMANVPQRFMALRTEEDEVCFLVLWFGDHTIMSFSPSRISTFFSSSSPTPSHPIPGSSIVSLKGRISRRRSLSSKN